MRAESLNGFPLLDLIRSLHTALLFIGSEKLPRTYHVLGWRAVALKTQISTIFRTSSSIDTIERDPIVSRGIVPRRCSKPPPHFAFVLDHRHDFRAYEVNLWLSDYIKILVASGV